MVDEIVLEFIQTVIAACMLCGSIYYWMQRLRRDRHVNRVT